MIRKEICEDNTFGGNFPYNINYPKLPEKLIDITDEQRIYIDNNKSKLIYDATQKGIFESPRGVVDISNTNAYKAKVAEKEAKIQNSKTITKRQLLFWLFQQKGIKEDAIFAAISTIDDEATQYLAEKSYTGTNNFEYGNPFVPVIGRALGLTIEEIKTMFDEAKEL